jgi:ammonium transporter, Amt family
MEFLLEMTEGAELTRRFGQIGVLVRVLVLLAAAWFTGGLATAQAVGQTDAATADRLAALEKSSAAQGAAIAAAQTAGDNAWMLTSSALVLLMSGPGLALFYGGLVRRKNVLGTMMQTFAMMAVITVLWALVTYSLAFGEGSAFIGGLHNVFLRGVGLTPDPKYAATIPLQTYMVFQLMFAIITPALITGAFAERMKFSAMLVFMVLWAIFVYSPMAHMVWGKGGLLNAALGGRFPCLDFAGGTVVHVTSGVSALVTALYLGKRVGYPQESMAPHSVVLSFVGACLLWVGCRAGRDLGSRGGTGVDYTGLCLCCSYLRVVDRSDRRSILLPDGGES